MNFTQGFGGFFTRSVVNSWNLHCYPVSAHEKESSQTLENGDKIILPETALDQLTRQMSLPGDEARMVVQAIEALNRDMLDS